jgi:hypothetical protein
LPAAAGCCGRIDKKTLKKTFRRAFRDFVKAAAA